MNLYSKVRNFAENRCKLEAASLSGLAAFFLRVASNLAAGWEIHRLRQSARNGISVLSEYDT